MHEVSGDKGGGGHMYMCVLYGAAVLHEVRVEGGWGAPAGHVCVLCGAAVLRSLSCGCSGCQKQGLCVVCVCALLAALEEVQLRD